MGTLRAKTIEPATGSTLTLGASGDTITVSSDSIKVNTFKDAGGNTLFTSDGGGTVSSVNSGIGAAGPVLISTATVTSSTTSVEFTTGIDSTYDEYMFVYTDFEPVNDGPHIQWQASTNGGSSYGVTATSALFLAYHAENNTVSGPSYNTGYDDAQSTSDISLNVGTGTTTDECAAGILHLYNPASTTYVKHFQARTQSYQDNDYSTDAFCSGYINTTTAINAVHFVASSGNIANVVIQMYGIA